MVTVVVLGLPIFKPIGELKETVNVSVGSEMVSPRIYTTKVAEESPEANLYVAVLEV